MHRTRNQEGYALLIVLLMIALFMSISAAFIAGSLSHAKQEQTVDTANQAVAAAEMGTVYFNSDFERELKLIKQEISDETHVALNELIVCIEYPMGELCDTEFERIAWEEDIEDKIRKSYISKIVKKAEQLDAQTISSQPFSGKDMDYEIASAVAVLKNAGREDIALPSTVDKTAKTIEVQLNITGTSKGVAKKLTAFLNIKIPDSFLNPDEPRNVQTNTITIDEDLTYEKIFALMPPERTCDELLAQITANTASVPYECSAEPGETLEGLVAKIEAAGLDPRDFRVYTDDFDKYVCETNCNNTNYKGISIVVQEGDAGSTNNMNNLVNANLIINGRLEVGNNLINLGKNGTKQTIIVKELEVGVNLKNLYYTNFLILGFEDPAVKAQLEWKSQIGIANYSNLCLDIDRIDQTDLDRLSREIDIVDSSKILYYTKYEDKFFKLIDAGGNDRMVTIKNEETGRNEQRTMTELYVQRESSYSNFLKNCGVTLKNSKSTSIDVSVPYPLDTDFDVEVKY